MPVDTAKELFIIVHGTWAQQESWAQPGGDFFENLWNNVGHNASISSYSWSGKNSNTERQRAAHTLATQLNKLPKDTSIRLIAHSHGANVCFLASQLLENSGKIIKTIYALGAPIDHARYQPNMNIINQIYNIFSFGDPVQTVSGCFERALPPHPRITNIAITCNNRRPNHAELHSPLVANWLTAVPNLCNQATLNSSDTSSSPSTTSASPSIFYGTLNLFDNQQPRYYVDNNIPTLLENEKKLHTVLAIYMMPRIANTEKLKPS